MIKFVSVMGKDFTVVRGQHGLDEGDDGRLDYSQQLITVRPGLSADVERETLLHEIVHAIEHTFSLKLKEREVESLAIGFYQLVIENPTLLRYLFTAGAPEREHNTTKSTFDPAATVERMGGL